MDLSFPRCRVGCKNELGQRRDYQAHRQQAWMLLYGGRQAMKGSRCEVPVMQSAVGSSSSEWHLTCLESSRGL
jgi:hypothetical protein